MNSSNRGVLYQLMRNGVNVGSPIEGNGSSVSFGTHNVEGTYSVTASNRDGECETSGVSGRIDPSGGTVDGRNLDVVAYPNPFSDQIRFTIVSDFSGQGVLEVYNLLGAKLKTVYQGYVTAGNKINVDFSVPGAQRVHMIYKMRVGNIETSGKLINIK